MKKLTPFFLLIIIAGICWQCIDQTNNEESMPVIEILSPLPCDTLYFGQEFIFEVKLTDNVGLGLISMDGHDNFGHHDHGNHGTCSFDPAKDPVSPWTGAWIFDLPDEEKEYIFDTVLTLPPNLNDTTNYDEGDYHFHITVTDVEGNAVFTALDTKIFN